MLFNNFILKGFESFLLDLHLLTYLYSLVDSLELWYSAILILLTGNLKNATVALDALSIWYLFI